MRQLTLIALIALALPGVSHAAPPANDNRADAEPIPTFPHTVSATTAEATVERLDPQVSRCGRVDGTVWYRIDTAPDGVIAVTVKGAAGVAPVIRIYRRGSSAIQELDCGSAGAGGSATASVEAVRGNNYLVLVGHRAGTAAGGFELRAELFLPPRNDDQSGAVPLRLPGSASGSTLGATGDESDPGCRLRGGTVWYRLASGRDARVLLRARANGNLDAAIVVLERVRTRMRFVACDHTDGRGLASLTFAVRRGGSYLIAVGHVATADPGTFTLQAFLSEAPESTRAGKRLPRAGVTSSVHGLTDVNDVWRVTLAAGTTYRLGLTSPDCVSVRLQSRRRAATLARLGCGGYTTFTPGPDGGGEYVLEVVAGTGTSAQRYRLLFAPAAPDDLGVGVELANRQPVRAVLDPGRLDVRDVYHFDLDERADVRVAVGGGLRFQLLRDDGTRVGTFSETRRTLGRGRYVVAVTGSVGEPATRYALSLLVRAITTTTLAVGSTTVAPRQPVSLRPVVANASGGTVELQIDRFDPLTGWHFNRLLRVRLGGTAGWAPPAEGKWRVRARFLGTIDASPSRSSYVLLEVRR